MKNTIKINQLQLVRMIAFGMLIIMPLLLIGFIYLIDPPEQSGGEIEMTLLILLIVGMLQPLAIPVIAKAHIQNWQRDNSETKSPAALFVMLSIVKFSLIEAIYIYALVVYLLSGNPANASYFYPVGMAWSAVHWPTRQRFENFVSKLNEK